MCHLKFLSESFRCKSYEDLEELIPDDLALRIDAHFLLKGEVPCSNGVCCNEGQIYIGKPYRFIIDKVIALKHDFSQYVHSKRRHIASRCHAGQVFIRLTNKAIFGAKKLYDELLFVRIF